MRVCMRVGAWVRGCVGAWMRGCVTPILLTLAKWHRMQPEPDGLEAGALEEHKHRHGTQAPKRPPQEPEPEQIKIKYTNAARSIGQQ